MPAISPQPRLLVVDDEPHNLDLVRRILGNEYQLDCFEDPNAALEALEKRAYDLILIDQRMPGITGVEILTRAARTQTQARRVILSGFTDSADLLPAINDGRIHRYLTKPIEPGSLRSCVRALTAGCAPGPGRWLVVDPDGQRGARIVTVLGEVDPHAVVDCSTTLDLTPDLSLLLLVEPSLEDLGSLVHDLGGPPVRIAILVASSASNPIPDAAYLKAGADDVTSLPVSPAELALRVQSLSLRHFAQVGPRRRSSSEPIESPSRTALVHLLVEDLVASGKPLEGLIAEIRACAAEEAKKRFGGDAAAAARHLGVDPGDLS